jgi:uncharacterized membrane-anchored protein
MQRTLAATILIVLGLTASVPARGQAPAGAGDPAKGDDKPFKPAMGPQKIELGHDLVLDLPADYLFLDAPQAKRLMEKNGNLWNDNLLGVVAKREANWLVTVRFTEDGYVKDDDAEKIDADGLLKEIREGTDEANKERTERGFKPLHVLGWSDPPRYQRDKHHLVWGMRAASEGEEAESVNFNTRILGRKSFVALNLIDSASTIDAAKPAAAILLAATTYKPGFRYQDFDKKTDKVAEYGLAALVLGGAGIGALKLVKIGLLAKFGAKILALLIAFKKALILLLVGAGAFIKKILGGKKTAPTAASDVAGLAAEQRPAEGGPGGQDGA